MILLVLIRSSLASIHWMNQGRIDTSMQRMESGTQQSNGLRMTHLNHRNLHFAVILVVIAIIGADSGTQTVLP